MDGPHGVRGARRAPELGIKAHAGYAELSARAFAKLFPFLDRWESIHPGGVAGHVAHQGL